MKHLTPINRKARLIEEVIISQEEDVCALSIQQPKPKLGPHYPLGCTLVFTPGWETDAAGSTAGLCQPVERDLHDCYLSCYWPVQVPDHLTNYPDWSSKCANATKDWRNIDLVFP
ncbi:MAG: quinohemoprotein amine dehydrogenase [Blastocatellia bacterium AA13]|nr:MAG: quinohemoprotein amine dehydrogenase [Blastocatellia bacterium AA13]